MLPKTGPRQTWPAPSSSGWLQYSILSSIYDRQHAQRQRRRPSELGKARSSARDGDPLTSGSTPHRSAAEPTHELQRCRNAGIASIRRGSRRLCLVSSAPYMQTVLSSTTRHSNTRSRENSTVRTGSMAHSTGRNTGCSTGSKASSVGGWFWYRLSEQFHDSLRRVDGSLSNLHFVGLLL